MTPEEAGREAESSKDAILQLMRSLENLKKENNRFTQLPTEVARSITESMLIQLNPDPGSEAEA